MPFYRWQNLGPERASGLLEMTQKSMIEKLVTVEGIDAFIRKAGNLGRMWTHVLRTTLKMQLSWDSFQRVTWEKRRLSESWRQGAGFCILLHSVQFLQMLSCPSVLPAGLRRGLWG